MQVGGAYNMRVIVRGVCAPEGEELFVRPEKKQWTYREKMAQANREAKATVVALAIVANGMALKTTKPMIQGIR